MRLRAQHLLARNKRRGSARLWRGKLDEMEKETLSAESAEFLTIKAAVFSRRKERGGSGSPTPIYVRMVE